MLRITSPVHGAVLNHRHGEQTDAGLTVTVTGESDLYSAVIVNGKPARKVGRSFFADVTLTAHASDITAVAEGIHGRREHGIRVLWDRHSRPRYRFSIDDNIFFIRDLIRTKPKSLFDCFYLDILRTLNRKYGAKFVLNLFYATPEADITLADFPDTYKDEFADNADWLRLSFHAYAEFPNRPYQYASAGQIGKDHDLVMEQVLRFAGEASWSAPTVIHWGMVHPAALPALVERGVKVLSGFFQFGTGTNYTVDDEPMPPGIMSPGCTGYDVNYWLDQERSDYVFHHDALFDCRTDIVYSRVDIVCNNVPVADTVPTLEPLMRNPDTAEIMDLFTHEQYFWPTYSHHRPDHVERLDTAIRFCTEQGYEPVWLHEGFMGVAE